MLFQHYPVIFAILLISSRISKNPFHVLLIFPEPGWYLAEPEAELVERMTWEPKAAMPNGYVGYSHGSFIFVAILYLGKHSAISPLPCTRPETGGFLVCYLDPGYRLKVASPLKLSTAWIGDILETHCKPKPPRKEAGI